MFAAFTVSKLEESGSLAGELEDSYSSRTSLWFKTPFLSSSDQSENLLCDSVILRVSKLEMNRSVANQF